jgi:hypothetical protein
MRNWLQQISDAVSRWPQVTAEPHRFGGTEFRFGPAEIGHIHRDGTLDIPFPMPVRNRLVAEGMVEKHHFLPDSGWITFRVGAAGVDRAIWLLRLSYLRYAARQAGNTNGWSSPEATDSLAELELLADSDLLDAMRSSLRLSPAGGPTRLA